MLRTSEVPQRICSWSNIISYVNDSYRPKHSNGTYVTNALKFSSQSLIYEDTLLKVSYIVLRHLLAESDYTGGLSCLSN